MAAAIGPFPSFSWPGVYIKTLNEAPTVTAAGGLRIPAFIGVADEYYSIDNLEMIRGSSSFADNQIVKEDVSSQLTGTNRNFTVTYKPIVVGDGNGTVTTNPNDVSVYVDDEKSPVASVDGTTGEVYLVSIPPSDSVVQISYSFKETDTLYSNEDLSVQADGSNVDFKVHHIPIVTGNNGGITTTSTSDVTARVNNTAVTVSAVDGDSGIVTLAAAPSDGDTVTITYYSNEHQDTSDIIPSANAINIRSVGLAAGSSDFIEGTDFVFDTSGNFATINWGHSYKVVSGTHTIATEYFDDSQISGTLFDNRTWKRETTGTTDGTNVSFVLEATPVSGQGLGYDTDDPGLVTAYVGSSPVDATAVTVSTLSASDLTMTLAEAPPADSTVYVTQYSNLLPDDTWTLTVTTAGGAGVGEYSLSGANAGVGMGVSWSTSDTTVADPDFSSENVTYPAGTGPGNSDAQVAPGYAVQETVSLTFIDASSYSVTSDNASGTGSSGDNTGYLNQTYIDGRTGFRVTVDQGTLVTYQAGDIIGYEVSPTFVTGTQPTRAIPGIRVTVSDTDGVGTGDTATLTTYNKSGNEPNIGDFYYVSFDEGKSQMEEALLFTQEKLALAYTGPLSQTNKLGLAAHLAFLNGAVAVALYQVPKTTGEEDAPDSAYISGIDYFNEPMEGGVRPALMEPVTTSSAVISYLKTSNTIQSGERYMNERMSYFGFPLNTSPATAQTYARSLSSERMIGIYPDGAILTITDELGNDVEYVFGGEMLAAALSGRDTSPAYDVAEPLTRKPVVGFTRLFRRLDAVTAAQTANAGLTYLEEQAAGIVVKIGLTTDLTSALTRTPSVIRIKDFVQRGTRAALDPYIGTKNLNTRIQEIETTLGSYLRALKQSQIINDYTGVKATVDPNDPTTINVEAFYQPVFPLLWIRVTFNLRQDI